MKVKRLFLKITALFFSLVMLFGVAACKPKLQSGGTGTRIYISLYSGGHGTVYFDTLIDNFMAKHPEYEGKYYIEYVPEKVHSGIVTDELTSGFGDKQMYVMAQNDVVKLAYSDLLEDLSDVALMKPDGENGKTIGKKMVRAEEWRSIYSKYGEGLYALPYADSTMSFVYDHDMFIENNWYTFAAPADRAAIEAQGIVCSEGTGRHAGRLVFVSADHKTNFEAGDPILTPGKDGKYGTYDDGQPITVEDWDNLIRKIGLTAKAFISAGGVGDYSQHVVSALFAQYSGIDAWNSYFTYDSNGVALNYTDGTSAPLTLETGYKCNWIDGIYKAFEFVAKYFDSRKSGDPLVSLHPAVTDGAKSHLDTQSLYLLGYQRSESNPMSAMLLDGAWWEYEARAMFNSLAETEPDRGYGKREYRMMLFPDLPGQKSEKSAISVCETGAFIVPKDSNKERLAVTKEFLAYMLSDEGIKTFTTITGSLMPYDTEFTEEDMAKLTPFTRNMIELYYDEENIDIVRPQLASMYSPIAYASDRVNFSYFVPKINGVAVTAPFQAVREYSLDDIKTGLRAFYSADEWARYIQQAKEQGFFTDGVDGE